MLPNTSEHLSVSFLIWLKKSPVVNIISHTQLQNIKLLIWLISKSKDCNVDLTGTMYFVAGRIEYNTRVPSDNILVDVSTGQVMVTGELNHDTTYTVEVTATDSGGLSSE